MQVIAVLVGWAGLVVVVGAGVVVLLRRVVAYVRRRRASRPDATAKDHFDAWSADCEWRTQRLARRVK